MNLGQALLACSKIRPKRNYNLQNPRKATYPGHRERDRLRKHEEAMNPPTERVCLKCGELKPIEQYRRMRDYNKSPRVKTCSKCENKIR